MRTKVPGLLLCLGALLVLLGAASGALGLADSMRATGSTWSTPGARDLQLSPGTWLVYQELPDADTRPTIPPRQVAVLGDSGSLALRCAYCSGSTQSLGIGGRHYVGVVSFQVPSDGRYKVTVTTPGQVVLVAPSAVGGVLAFMGGFLLAAIGGVVCLLAIIWLVIGAVTTGRPRRAPQGSQGLPVPGPGQQVSEGSPNP